LSRPRGVAAVPEFPPTKGHEAKQIKCTEEVTKCFLKDQSPKRAELTSFDLRSGFKIKLQFLNIELNPKIWLFDPDTASSAISLF
jgi:hypothetical protein